jgi:predicted O-linked N-acetylglucosamine transferase (SPINDLY family)
VGASLLHRIGRPEWIADSPEDYIAIARKLAEDPGELAIIRAGLRTKLLASSLCDAAGFTRTLETACRTIWHDKYQRAS